MFGWSCSHHHGANSGLKELLDGLMRGCHWARKVIAVKHESASRGIMRHRDQRERTPHDVATGKGEYKRAAPDGLIVAFG